MSQRKKERDDENSWWVNYDTYEIKKLIKIWEKKIICTRDAQNVQVLQLFNIQIYTYNWIHGFKAYPITIMIGLKCNWTHNYIHVQI